VSRIARTGASVPDACEIATGDRSDKVSTAVISLFFIS
jgi:hypothetical protein